MKLGIVICSRTDSSRVHRKPFRLVGYPEKNLTLIHALLIRLIPTEIPICVAVPEHEVIQYQYLEDFFGKKRVTVFGGGHANPMQRMFVAARTCGFDEIIRINHDKVFVDSDLIRIAVDLWRGLDVDYFFSSRFTDGSGFEIFTRDVLNRALEKFAGQNIEHISYAIKAVTNNVHNYLVPPNYRSSFNLLIDEPKDLNVIDYIFKRFKARTLKKSLPQILDYMRIHPEVSGINKYPTISFYTCAYNAEKYIEEAMESVAKQKLFKESEYILVNDASTDNTATLMEDFARKHSNVSIIKNKKNIGLASSSNLALEAAFGHYLIRLDADDFFLKKNSASELLRVAREKSACAVYPNNCFGSYKNIQKGSEHHHVGGAIFKRRAINDIKFTEGLRGFEGLDFFHRAKDKLDIAYLDSPIFFYRQHSESLTKNNLVEREAIKQEILSVSN